MIGSLLAVVALLVAALGPAAPAAGQDGGSRNPIRIVTITSAPVAGTYTISWRTLGGCDPGAGTSGMEGEIRLTVEATDQPGDDPEPGELTGTPVEDLVVIRPSCTYRWTRSMIEATTDGNCIVGPTPFEPDDDFELNITLEDPETSCSHGSRIIVRVNPAVAVDVDPTDHNAILRAPISATATPIEGAPEECKTTSDDSTTDDNDTPNNSIDDIVSIELLVVDATAAGRNCRYDVSLAVSGHLVVTLGGKEIDVLPNIDPFVTIDVFVSVASRTIYLLQTVVGDSGAANVRYALSDPSETCGDPSLVPPAMPSSPTGGGSQGIENVRLVELREGRFNITAAIAADLDAFDGVTRRTLDGEGETCRVTVSLSQLPAHCLAERDEVTADLTRSPEPTILEFVIACGGGTATGDNTG